MATKSCDGPNTRGMAPMKCILEMESELPAGMSYNGTKQHHWGWELGSAPQPPEAACSRFEAYDGEHLFARPKQRFATTLVNPEEDTKDYKSIQNVVIRLWWLWWCNYVYCMHVITIMVFSIIMYNSFANSWAHWQILEGRCRVSAILL